MRGHRQRELADHEVETVSHHCALALSRAQRTRRILDPDAPTARCLRTTCAKSGLSKDLPDWHEAGHLLLNADEAQHRVVQHDGQGLAVSVAPQ